MITYDKERKGWSFKDATDDEREALAKMAEPIWATLMAEAIANIWLKQDIEAHGDKIRAEASLEGLKDALTNPDDNVIFPDFGKKPH